MNVKNRIMTYSLCKKSGPKSTPLDFQGNLALSQVVQDPTLIQVGIKSKLTELGFQFYYQKFQRLYQSYQLGEKKLKKDLLEQSLCD